MNLDPNDINSLRQEIERLKSVSYKHLDVYKRQTMDNFMDEYLAHVVDHKCPSGQCKALLQYVIEAENCVGCTACARNCPVNAIAGERKGVHVIDQETCIKCGACLEKCKFNAVFIK